MFTIFPLPRFGAAGIGVDSMPPLRVILIIMVDCCSCVLETSATREGDGSVNNVGGEGVVDSSDRRGRVGKVGVAAST
jgi:hypothetical protein